MHQINDGKTFFWVGWQWLDILKINLMSCEFNPVLNDCWPDLIEMVDFHYVFLDPFKIYF